MSDKPDVAAIRVYWEPVIAARWFVGCGEIWVQTRTLDENDRVWLGKRPLTNAEKNIAAHAPTDMATLLAENAELKASLEAAGDENERLRDMIDVLGMVATEAMSYYAHPDVDDAFRAALSAVLSIAPHEARP